MDKILVLYRIGKEVTLATSTVEDAMTLQDKVDDISFYPLEMKEEILAALEKQGGKQFFNN